MKPTYQTRKGDDGNCFAAALASLLETDLPEFGRGVDESTFWKNVDHWLAARGLRYTQVPIGADVPVGWSTIEGTSPRGGQHACVAYKGRIVFDPHSPDGSGQGLVEPRVYGLLLPAKQKATDFKPPSFLTLAIVAALYLYLRDVHDRKAHAAEPEPYAKYFGTKAL